MPDVHIRAAFPTDEEFLREMQYTALFVPDGHEPLPAAVVDTPGIARYWQGFGSRPGDVGCIAMDGDTPIGAAWARRFGHDDPGYGFVDADTPELGIAVAAPHRGRGVGGRLLRELLDAAGPCSLSVHPDNPARHLYQRTGFVEVRRTDDAVVMVAGR